MSGFALPFDIVDLQQLRQLHFLRPWWLLALLLLPVLAWHWRIAAQRRRGVWQDAVDGHLLAHLLDGEARRAGRARFVRWAGLLAAALAILAAAGPAFRKDEQPLWQTRAPLVVVVDMSSATLARDLPPSRLPQARAKIAALLRERQGGQVALVAFADDAFTVAPLTEDAANVALFLDALAPDVMPADGQRADRAIAWSQRLLRQSGYDHGDILLLTDHADGEARQAATTARAAGYRVSAIGLGREAGGVFETMAGIGRAKLDAASLRGLATDGGGAYATLTPDDADLRALGVLDARGEAGASGRGEKAASWRDDGYWLLPLAMLLALPLFRRNAGAAVLALCLLLPLHPARAQETDSLWQRPDQAAHARMGAGVAAYRDGRYDEAIERFSGIGSADGQYNLGNALAKAGRYDEAIDAYDRALKRQPKMTDAIANRAAVEKARKPPPPQGGQSQQDKQQKQDQQQGSQQNPPQQQPQGGDRQKPPDAQQQQQADAEQRQRMQDAMRRQQQQQAAQAKDGKRPEETDEQRERRLANQAQLQRVPDDPGGLLRARFRLEAQRRQREGR